MSKLGSTNSLTFSGNNSYIGGTNISGGTLAMGSTTALGNGNVNLYAGTLTTGFSPTIAALSGTLTTAVVRSNVAGAVR